MDTRIREVKARRAQANREAPENAPAPVGGPAKNRIGAWAATIAAGLCTEEGIGDREVVERAVNMAEMIDRLIDGRDPEDA